MCLDTYHKHKHVKALKLLFFTGRSKASFVHLFVIYVQRTVLSIPCSAVDHLLGKGRALGSLV